MRLFWESSNASKDAGKLRFWAISAPFACHSGNEEATSWAERSQERRRGDALM